MPIKNDREYRNYEMLKRAKEEGNDEPSYLVEGYASTFDAYTLWEDDEAVYREQIDPKAFDEADLSDVVFLLDHTGRVYARTKNDTVKLSVDDNGFFTSTDLSKTSSSRAVFEDIEAGNYSQMSFAFRVADDHYIESHSEGEKPVYLRVIDRISKVFDISAVGFPANPTTNIGVATRSAFNGGIEKLKAERLCEAQHANEVARAKLIAKIKFMEANHDN